MSDPVNIYGVKTQLSRLVERAAAGEEVIIARAGKPIARLVALQAEPRRPGQWKGRITVGDDLDDPLPDELLAAFGGQAP